MKTILVMALVLAVYGAADAAEIVDPVGTWKCEYEIGGQKRTSTLTIKKDGEKLAATMSWPDQKETNLTDLKLEGDTLTFSAVRKMANLEIPIEYKLTIDGDMLKGKGASDYGGQRQEWDIHGKKVDPVGTWKCEYEIGGQKRTSTMSIKQDGDKLAATMSWPDQKETNLTDLVLEGDTLTFSAVRKMANLEIPIEYKLTIDGDMLKGKGASEYGGQHQEWEINGKKEKKDK
jgi:opacity protein-like surface antigen